MWYVIAAALGYVAYYRLAHANASSGSPALPGGGGSNLNVAAEDAAFERAVDELLAEPLASAANGGGNTTGLREEALKVWYAGDPHDLANLAGEVKFAPLMLETAAASAGEGAVAEKSPFLPGMLATLPSFKAKVNAFAKIVRDKIERLTGQGSLLDAVFAKIDNKTISMDLDNPDPVVVRAGMIDKASRNPLMVINVTPTASGQLAGVLVKRGEATELGSVVFESVRPVGVIDGQPLSIGRIVSYTLKPGAFSTEGVYFGKDANIYVAGLGSA